MGRFGRPEDVVHMALYLASDESTWVNGSVMVVDGGQNLPGSALFNIGAEQLLRAQEQKTQAS